MTTLDETDLQILRVLQDNSRLTVKELAQKVSLSATPVYERMKRLEREGFIKKYIALLDVNKLNQGFIVYCNVKLRRINREIVNEFIETIKQIPEVTECYNISLGTIDCLDSWESTFVMSEVKNEHGIKF